MSENQKNQIPAQARQSAGHPRRKRRRLSAFAYFLIIFSLLIVAGICSAMFFLKVQTITVSGKTAYSQEQIITASGLRQGESIFFTNREKAVQEICKSLPFIGSASIRYRPFTGLTIEVKPAAAVYEIMLRDGYAKLDKSGKILEITAKPEKSSNLPVIKGIVPDHPAAGLTLSEKDQKQVGQAAEILSGFKSNRITGVKSVDVSNLFEITANYDGRINILIGTPADLSYKLKFAAYLLKSKNDISDTDKGVLDISQSAQSNKASFIPS